MMNQSRRDFCRSWNGPKVIISMSLPSKATRQSARSNGQRWRPIEVRDPSLNADRCRWNEFPEPQLVESIGVEHRGNRYRKASQHHRRRQIPATTDACFLVSLAEQPQNADRFRLRVNNPVFRNTPLGIVTAFFNEISFRFLFAHNLESDVSTEPESVLPAGICGRCHEEKIGLTIPAWANSQA